MNAERQYPGLSSADRKRLYILEQLEQEWSLSGHKQELRFGWQRYNKWIAESGIEDTEQLLNILEGFKKEGLIVSARPINPGM